MRTVNRVLLASGSAILAGLWAAPALAQKDTQPKLPNVLLLVDSSGSLEYLLDYGSKLPGDPSAPNTACDGSTARAQRNRWTNLVTAMTGSIADTDFSCRAVQRTGSNFLAEFALNSTRPYDYGYYLPFNRIYSNNCAYGAGTVKSDWKWSKMPADDGGKNFTYRDTAGNEVASCNFVQSNDGLLDSFRSLVRFGFMAEDTLADPATGSDGNANPGAAKADYDGGNKGMWSYYRNWLSGPPASPTLATTTSASGPLVDTARPAAGNPAGCPTPAFMEVGARNQAAPPWEGRLVGFGDWDSDLDVATTNDQIQMQLLTMRPYGASPLAGLLDDAEEFLFHDTTKVPGKTFQYGPSDDKYWQFGCRKTYLLLLSDGQPNMDLRSPGGGVTGCDSAEIGGIKGVCPYDTPDAIATRLRVSPPANQAVNTYVIGFTRSEFTDMSPVPSVPSGATRCEDLKVDNGGTDCVNPPPQLKACCNLQKIAVAGDTKHAYFADTQNKLKQAMSAILSQIVAGTTDRTWPVYAPGGNRLAMGSNFNPTNPTAAYQFAASFAVSPAGKGGVKSFGGGIPSMWNGRLMRERTSCPQSSNTPTVQGSKAADGDNYAYNVDMSDGANPRRFFTAIGEADGNKINSEITMRPYIATDDGLGTYKTASGSPSSPAVSSTFVTQMTTYPPAFGMPADGPCKSAFGDPITPAQCTIDLVQWEIGLNNTLPSKVPFLTRDWRKCPIACSTPSSVDASTDNACSCSQFGAVYHSTPVVVGPPREFLRDESYITYQNTPAVAKQPTVLYTATMDGQLHAFKVQSNDPNDSSKTDDQGVNNELWSFFPPAVLKGLLPNYNTGGVPLLDGQVVIADVPGTLYTSAQAPVLERKGNDPVTWHRVLLGGGGAAGGFYYALDITDPQNPRFLWQLSRDQQGNPLFGTYTPTPTIAIVNLLVNGETRQVPVAIMPGGGTGAKETKCHKKDSTASPYAQPFSNMKLDDQSNPHLVNGITAAAPALQCWKKVKDNLASSANSLVVARLDTGKVLGFFLGDSYSGAPKYGDGGDDGEGGDSKDDKKNHFTNVFDAPFQGPLTGVPVAYPGQTGQVSDRVYVGDADGLLWRLDMSNPDITKWKVELAWDAYIEEKETPDPGTSLRENIGVVPIISRDAIGNPVILVATGDQDQFNSQPTTNHVWSLTENPLTKKVSPNWHIAMGFRGARVTGPMTLFNGALYFATFRARPPSTTNVCEEGYGSVWAVDFVRKMAGQPISANAHAAAGVTADAAEWPLPQFPSGSIGVYHWGQDGDKGTIIMGVSTSETPTCDAQITTGDPYFGNHTALSGVTGSSYQVSWQTGAGKGLSGGAVQNNGNGVQSVTPPAPGGATRIDSWASIVE